MSFAGRLLESDIRTALQDFASSTVHAELARFSPDPLAIKYTDSRWAAKHAVPSPLKISDAPLQTWGTATYVAPITYPLTSALYGRIGVVSDFDPSGWSVFDATSRSARSLYQRWARAQPEFEDLLLTVHSTRTNLELRNRFRERFHIDCVLFHPDQEAELHTDARSHVWMAVSDWDLDARTLRNDFSDRLSRGRFTVLIDEDFESTPSGLPARAAPRLIEPWTTTFGVSGPPNECQCIRSARTDPQLPARIANAYHQGSYVHLFIEP